jgi:hypothetical protein
VEKSSGEPVICGFARTLGIRLPTTEERYEYIKPIMFSAGIGTIDNEMIHKKPCAKNQLVAKLGGPVYRIGLGGGAASSVHIQGYFWNFSKFDVSKMLKDQSTWKKTLCKNYIFETFMKNRAFFVFTACSESL